MSRPSKQEIEDMRKDAAASKAEKLYMESMTSTEEAPAGAGAGRGFVNPPVKKMAKGGSASSRADGCAERGKTKGTMISMNYGGKAC
tara:strand:+ start:3700 stop:3960 length:261 start_codon:yes stop_codon:yes gene_type:complete